MTSRKVLWTAAAGVTAGAALTLRRARTRQSARAAENRWLSVTINCRPGDIHPEKLPSPLHEYGDLIEARVRPAPGDRGTEVAVRLNEGLQEEPRTDTAHSFFARLTGDDPRQDLRRALREAKAQLEAGEVLRPDEPTTHDTPGGKLVGLMSRRAGGEGVL